MTGILCTLALINTGMEILNTVLFLVYYIWATFAKWFHVDNIGNLDNLKHTLDSVELYVNTVEYTSLAIIPIQIFVILLTRCCCKGCQKCRDRLEGNEDQYDVGVKNMNMSKSEFTA